ncbi:MAG: hypothetical protein A3D28_04285 [Omnitrophica bacterium RIFCSPHIGHO2_02_FULL_63_14]|nr:MAG: hypothetical protein A3D28_04285 [Omnitrophica bacterium RIFCSPHIGHO2_02_FULL_63_14]
MTLFEASNLTKRFKKLIALDGVSFKLERGRTLGVLGDSGSGKSTLAKTVVGLLKPDGGCVRYHGTVRPQIIFQQPFSSLNPRWTVGDILKEPFLIRRQWYQVDLVNLVNQVNLSPAYLTRYPRHLSGGECQRVAIARALALEPELLVCDEPVASLDVLSQVLVLDLLLKLQAEKGVSLIFISHDPRAVRRMSDEVMVLKGGKVV